MDTLITADAHRPTTNTASTSSRDLGLDLVRAGSMFVVVAWHWVFTILSADSSGLHADNPVAYVPNLAYVTWVLQVMPLFFLVGGLLTTRSARSLETTGERMRWVGRRMRRLLGPALPVVGVLAAGIAISDHVGAENVSRALWLAITPLWFLGVYLAVTCLLPLWGPAARRWPVGHVLALVALSIAWDVARFSGWVSGASLWVSMVLVWLAVHQAGGLVDRLSTRGARMLVAGSLLALVAGSAFGPYPASMVGNSADEISNMGPPTAMILALGGVQLGLLVLLRPAISRWAARHHSVVGRAAELAMPVYLWHMVPFGLVVGGLLALGVSLPSEPTAMWWAMRPFFVIAPLCLFIPLLRRVAPARARA